MTLTKMKKARIQQRTMESMLMEMILRRLKKLSSIDSQTLIDMKAGIQLILFSIKSKRRKQIHSLKQLKPLKLQSRPRQTFLSHHSTFQVVEVYTMVGKMLKTYKSGKLPKALKMLPHLKNWEVISILMNLISVGCSLVNPSR